MAKPEIAVLRPVMPRILDALTRDAVLHHPFGADDPEAALKELSPRVRIAVTFGWCPAHVMEALPNLELIASFAVGYDGIDVEHARSRGIMVTNTPDVLTDEVANFAAALVLAVTRQIPRADRYVREESWLQGVMPFNRTIIGRRIGIVGAGRIGQATARRLNALGADVVWHGPRPKPELPWPYYSDLAAMAADCFGLVLTCPGGAATRGIVNRDVMTAIGREGFLVNVARGSVVDEPEMVSMLQDGSLGAAGLDVFRDEPNVPRELFGLDNVVLQPHQASATVETRNAMADLVVENARLFLAGQPVRTPVT